MNLIEKIDLKERVYGGVDGAVQLLVAQQSVHQGKLVYVARDDARMAQMQQGLAALDPDLNIQILPAWDCLPYDRVSPHAGIISQRIQTLSNLYSMARQRISELLRQAVGPYACPYISEQFDEGYNEPPIGPEDAMPLARQYFNLRKLSIYGGSNEIQKNIVAKTVLGL